MKKSSSLIVLLLCAISNSGWAQNIVTQKRCQDFKAQLAVNKQIQQKQLQVSKFHKSGAEKITLFYWIRPALANDKSYAPLLLIHGGPGSNSAKYSTWKSILDKYPGDVVSLDLRGEGCSNFFNYDLDYLEYKSFSSNLLIVEDLEALRKELYGPSTQWRVFGQSRGSMIAHRYFELYPDAFESLSVHGFAMQSDEGFANYSITRSFFNARAGKYFVNAYPESLEILSKLRKWLRQSGQNICFNLNFNLQNLPPGQQPQICGEGVVDAFSGKLSDYSKWSALDQSLKSILIYTPDGASAIHPTKAMQLIQSTLNDSLYVQYMNYILGTNSQDVSAPDPFMLKILPSFPDLANAPLSEGRFIIDMIYPLYVRYFGSNFRAGFTSYNFAKVISYLQNRQSQGRPFEFNIFISKYDPVAGPEAYDFERQQLGKLARFIDLTNSAHEGWFTEAVVADTLLK